MNTPRFRSSALFAPVLILLLLAVPAAAQEDANDGEEPVVAETVYEIQPDGVVDVVDSWQNLRETGRTFNYESFTNELGTIPVRLNDRSFELNFSSRSYLRQEGPQYYFRSRAYFYEGAPLDLTVTLRYPSGYMSYVSSTIEPSRREEGEIVWEEEDVSGRVIEVEFDRRRSLESPWSDLAREQIDPTLMPELEAHEIPDNAEQVLKDFQLLVQFAEANNSADANFINELRRLQSQLYYIFLVRGLISNPDLKPQPPGEGEGVDYEQEAEDSDEEPF